MLHQGGKIVYNKYRFSSMPPRHEDKLLNPLGVNSPWITR